jgi:hypothetical protein
MNWKEIIGKKIVALRGFKREQWDGKFKVYLDFILFADKETYIELRQQDKYDYHDCNYEARTLTIRKDAKMWKKVFDKYDNYDEPDNLKNPF